MARILADASRRAARIPEEAGDKVALQTPDGVVAGQKSGVSTRAPPPAVPAGRQRPPPAPRRPAGEHGGAGRSCGSTSRAQTVRCRHGLAGRHGRGAGRTCSAADHPRPSPRTRLRRNRRPRPPRRPPCPDGPARPRGPAPPGGGRRRPSRRTGVDADRHRGEPDGRGALRRLGPLRDGAGRAAGFRPARADHGGRHPHLRRGRADGRQPGRRVPQVRH